jgi:hypothetical protein
MIQKVVNYANLPLNILRTDLGTQSRYLGTETKQAQYQQAIRHYASEMNYDRWRWQDSPPIVFGPTAHLGIDIYLPGDGHTRIEAARLAGFEKIFCQVNPGGAVDALRYSLGPANRNFLSNRLDASDITYRIYLVLKDREMWCWVDRRIIDYCDDGNRLVKLRKVAIIRRELLDRWSKEDLAEYQWRIERLEAADGLKDVDSEGNEFKVSQTSSQLKRSSSRVNPGDVSKLAYTTAQFRAAQAGCDIQQWIEAAILLADRQVDLNLSFTKSETRYNYSGNTKCFDIFNTSGVETGLTATISPGYQMTLVDSVDCDLNLLPVRLTGCLWEEGFHLKILIQELDWVVES